jgi:hypothetical protein
MQHKDDKINLVPTEYSWEIAFNKAIDLESSSQNVFIVERKWDSTINKMLTIVYFVKDRSIYRNDNKLLPVYSLKREFELSKEFKLRLLKMRNDIHNVYKKYGKDFPYINDEYHGLTVLEMFYKYEDFLKDKFILSLRENIFNKLSDINKIIASLNIEPPFDMTNVKNFDMAEIDTVYNFITNKQSFVKSWIVSNCY